MYSVHQCRKFKSAVNLELSVNIFGVIFNCVFGNEKYFCNIAIAVTVTDKVNNLKFAFCKDIKNVFGSFFFCNGFFGGLFFGNSSGEVIKECREKGVIVIKAKDKIRLLPALNIPWELLKRAVEVIKTVNS